MYYVFFFFFKQKTAYEIGVRLVGSEMCIRDRSMITANCCADRSEVRALADQDAEPEERVDVFLTGLAFLDVVFTGLDSPPVAGTEIWAKGLGSGPGGISNFAVALRRLGLTTAMAAAFGADLPGDLCRRMLADAGVDLSRSRRFEDWSTPVTVAVPYPGDRALITYGEPPPVSQEDLVGVPPDSRAALVHLAPDSGEWIARAQAAGSLVFAEVGWDPS